MEIKNLKATILGTGPSWGCPVLGCDCKVCKGDNPKNKRLRSSVCVSWETIKPIENDNPEKYDRSLIIDAGPDFREQSLRSSISAVNAVFLTHEHSDHIEGIDDLRSFSIHQGSIPLYGSKKCIDLIKNKFSYCWRKQIYGGGLPQLIPEQIEPYKSVHVHGIDVIPINVEHGQLDAFGFIIGDFGYIPDAHFIPEESIKLLKQANLKTFFLDCSERRVTSKHFHPESAIEMAKIVGAKKTYLTHISHQFDYDEFLEELPENIEPAYDELTFEINI
ncbi:hydrolase [Anaeramoeba flamelloides]|uniref:Hydrolase n=1 Tax=Anaeramoeba flamelloides TaxID=1746091 RepID=A0AAV8A7Q3_9EUKA|nr:hydrolase [Anaeramoeba flamelloides]